jgi:hypothetical protein
LGSHQFKVGSFVQGQASSLDLEALIPLGVATLQVFERDIELDELLGEIDLPQEMEVERVVTLWASSARYMCWLQVSSQLEG